MVSGYAVGSSTGFQPVEDEIKELREHAAQAYDEVQGYNGPEGEPLHTANREDVMEFASDLYTVYEDLLGVEMDGEARQLFDDSIS